MLASNDVAPHSITDRPFGEPAEYVLNQVIDTALAKDKEFLAWRSKHPQSFVPRVRCGFGRAQARRTPRE